MNKSAINTIVCIFKYISIIILTGLIILVTDILENVFSGEIKNFVSVVARFLTTNISITSVIMLICIVVILISNVITYFIKLDTESSELKKIDNENINRIYAYNNQYNNLSKKINSIESNLSDAQNKLYKETYTKIFKISRYCDKMEAHYERRKANYFVTNEKLYGIVKNSKAIDNETVKLIKEFKTEINTF